MHRCCVKVMRRIEPELICAGHRKVYTCDRDALDTYADFVVRKERVFRSLVAEPHDQFIDLFWARLLPYVSLVEPGGELTYTLRLRNNLERRAAFAARLLPAGATGGRGEPLGEDVLGDASQSAFTSITLDAGAHGELTLCTRASANARTGRSLITAEIQIDGISQGPIAEALVTVVQPDGRQRWS